MEKITTLEDPRFQNLKRVKGFLLAMLELFDLLSQEAFDELTCDQWWEIFYHCCASSSIKPEDEIYKRSSIEWNALSEAKTARTVKDWEYVFILSYPGSKLLKRAHRIMFELELEKEQAEHTERKVQELSPASC